jgi:hypothetical protein
MNQMSESKFYVFELVDFPSGIPFAQTTDNGIAAFVFSSPSIALNYAAQKGHTTDWRVRELDVFGVRDWLVDAKNSNNVTSVWPDPNPDEEGHRELPIDAFLAAVSSACNGD